MPMLFLYLTKVSISLAVMYLFYRFLLQHLTFYNSNRWYLLGYSVLCFFIPFINISGVLDQSKLSGSRVIQIIPVINDLNNKNPVLAAAPVLTWSMWDYLLLIFFAGITVMLFRFALQWLSYLSIKGKARLLFNEDVNLYEVATDIVPFSFGRSVFINSKLHSQDELKEILRHEYVHVQQNHTVDVIWAEMLCLFNWYNPFAWLIRHSIRQNLEFIADHKVLENGIAKKQYQYLLLKVLGVPQFHIAPSFNFSSLKKRIVMMNKIRSSKVHMIRFLFVLPLLAVLLLAFRINIKKGERSSGNPHLTIAGLVMQGDNYEALANVSYKDSASQITGSTDEKGFYILDIPVMSYPYETNITFTKEGYQKKIARTTIGSKEHLTDKQFLEYVGMRSEKSMEPFIGAFVAGMPAPDIGGKEITYELVANNFETVKHSRNKGLSLDKIISGSQKPYWVLNGHTYVITAAGSMASVDTVTDVVFVDGKKMTGKEVNEKFTRSVINAVGAIGKEDALKRYGENQEAMEIYVNTRPAGWGTIPKKTL